MSQGRYAREREAAIEAVLAASRLCRVVQRQLVESTLVSTPVTSTPLASTPLIKGDKSPVTVADFGSQAVVSHLLERAFPEVPLLGEEDASALREPGNEALKGKVLAALAEAAPDLDEAGALAAIDRGVHAGGPTGRYWTLDPIDGTKGFLRLEQYAVALALIEDGEVVLGVLGCPNLPLGSPDPDGPGERGCLFVAVEGEGAWMRSLTDAAETPVRVDGVVEPSQARFCESVEAAHSSQSDSAVVAQKLGISAPPVRMDSQCKYAAVARGDASIYLRLPTRADYVERVWDHAAGWRVIVEAGGQVTDVTGAPLDFSLGRGLEKNKGVIVTNGPLHAAVLAAVASTLRG